MATCFKTQEVELKNIDVWELLGWTGFWNKNNRGTAKVRQLGNKVRQTKLRLVWTCAQEVQQIHWQKDAQDRVTRQESKRKTNEEIHGCGEDMQIVGVKKEDAGGRERWKRIICCGGSYKHLR